MVVNFGCHSLFYKIIHTLQMTTYLLTIPINAYTQQKGSWMMPR